MLTVICDRVFLLFFAHVYRALQLHPTEASFWVGAALWEFEHARNMAAARGALDVLFCSVGVVVCVQWCAVVCCGVGKGRVYSVVPCTS